MISSIDLITDGWACTQSPPLTASMFIRLAKERGFRLKMGDLESLYRENLLIPLLAVHDEPQGRRIDHTPSPRRSLGRYGIDEAADEGRLSDPAITALPVEWRFERADGDSAQWWNGLLYSRWQLLEFANLTDSFTMGGHRRFDQGRWSRLPDWAEPMAQVFRELAILLSAIEPRYRPVADENWIRLRGPSARSGRHIGTPSTPPQWRCG